MKKKSTIFRQLLTPIFLLLCILVIAIMCMLWIFMSSYFRKQVASSNAASTSLLANDISGFLSEAYAVSEELAVNPTILTMDTEIQTPVLKNCAERNDYFELIYIQGADGMQTGRSSGELADRSARWWFIQAMEEKQPFVSKTYYSVNTDMPCTSVFIPMKKEEEIVGILASDIKLDSLVALIDKFSEDDKTYFIIDGEGTVVAHPDRKYIQELYNYKTLTHTISQKDASGSVMRDENDNILTKEEPFTASEGLLQAVNAVMNREEGSSFISNEGEKCLVSYSPILLEGNSDSWSVLMIQNYSSAMAPTFRLLMLLVMVSLFFLVIIMIIMAVIIKRISFPVVELSDLVSEASEGNFAKRAKENHCRELSLLSQSFNMLITKFSKILSEILEVIAGVTSSKDNLGNLSEKAEEIVQEMQQISDGAMQQEEDIKKAADLTDQVQDRYLQLLNLDNKVMGEAKNVLNLCRDGKEKILQLEEQNQYSLERAETSYQRILQLSGFSEQVGSIVGRIDEISEQTSLLALNASIEAARAGEQGKGFAVVAGEISHLANNTQEATKLISDIMEKLRKEVEETVNMVSGIKEGFQNQSSYVVSVKDAFGQFDSSTKITVTSIQNMEDMLQEVSQLNEMVVEAVENIQEISKTVAEKTEVVAGVVEQQKDEIAKVTKKVGEVYYATKILSNDMSKFTI